MGGTEILEPLRHAIEMKTLDGDSNGHRKKIFLLTDGEVSSPD